MQLSAEAKIWFSAFLAFKVYTPTLLQYQLNERAGDERLGCQYSVCGGKCCAPCRAADQHWIKWAQTNINKFMEERRLKLALMVWSTIELE